ncbi:hypothetical protein [Pyrodictium occultum]|nr:hypothetical protein [Pyrodictium occultum]
MIVSLVSRGQRVAPAAVVAAGGGRRLCSLYRSGAAVAAVAGAEGPGWSCREGLVAVLYPSGGVARLEARGIDRVLYG